MSRILSLQTMHTMLVWSGAFFTTNPQELSRMSREQDTRRSLLYPIPNISEFAHLITHSSRLSIDSHLNGRAIQNNGSISNPGISASQELTFHFYAEKKPNVTTWLDSSKYSLILIASVPSLHKKIRFQQWIFGSATPCGNIYLHTHTQHN